MDENFQHKEMNPLVSIIIPIYNSEQYLSETIESAINQTWSNKEIILIDDGSTDNSLAVAKNYERDWVKVYSQENKGASSARNHGLKVAKGEYIQFLDADDLLCPDKINRQIKLLIEDSTKLAIGPAVYFYDGSNPLLQSINHEWYKNGSKDPIDFLIKLYGGSVIGPAYGGMITIHSWLTPRKIIDKAGSWNENLSVDDDGEFFCRVVLNSKGIMYSPKSFNYYRKFINRNSLSSQQSYSHNLSALNANILKTKQLLTYTNNNTAKLAMSRCFWENTFNFYPNYPSLSRAAEKLALTYGNRALFNPYPKGINKILSNLLGWKIVKRLQTIKSKTIPYPLIN